MWVRIFLQFYTENFPDLKTEDLGCFKCGLLLLPFYVQFMFVMRCLQSSQWGRESWLLYFNCILLLHYVCIFVFVLLSLPHGAMDWSEASVLIRNSRTSLACVECINGNTCFVNSWWSKCFDPVVCLKKIGAHLTY